MDVRLINVQISNRIANNRSFKMINWCASCRQGGDFDDLFDLGVWHFRKYEQGFWVVRFIQVL